MRVSVGWALQRPARMLDTKQRFSPRSPAILEMEPYPRRREARILTACALMGGWYFAVAGMAGNVTSSLFAGKQTGETMAGSYLLVLKKAEVPWRFSVQ